MQIEKTGIILYTRKYETTVEFYKSIFQLETLYVKQQLTCLDFNGAYLMIELDDEKNLIGEEIAARDKFCVRFNVPDVKAACNRLEEVGVDYKFFDFDWGQLAKFRDPDGNLVGIRSAKEHETDIIEAKV